MWPMPNLDRILWSVVRARPLPHRPNRMMPTMWIHGCGGREVASSAEMPMTWAHNTRAHMIDVVPMVALIDTILNLVNILLEALFQRILEEKWIMSWLKTLSVDISDEFSSQDEDDSISISKNSTQIPNQRDAKPKIISRCKAIYCYTPKLSDELRINPGRSRRTRFHFPEIAILRKLSFSGNCHCLSIQIILSFPVICLKVCYSHLEIAMIQQTFSAS